MYVPMVKKIVELLHCFGQTENNISVTTLVKLGILLYVNSLMLHKLKREHHN